MPTVGRPFHRPAPSGVGDMMEITRKTIEDKLRELKQRLEPLLDCCGFALGSTYEQLDVRCIRSQIWLLEEILKGGD